MIRLTPQPNEIYEDEHGDRWLVTSIYQEPTVGMQRIEPRWQADQPLPEKRFGGVTGLMWQGFRKIADAPKQGGST